jgi:hypothetical protein
MTKPTFIICLVLMLTSIGIALGLVFGGAWKNGNGNNE